MPAEGLSPKELITSLRRMGVTREQIVEVLRIGARHEREQLAKAFDEEPSSELGERIRCLFATTFEVVDHDVRSALPR